MTDPAPRRPPRLAAHPVDLHRRRRSRRPAARGGVGRRPASAAPAATAELVRIDGGNPLVVGDLRADRRARRPSSSTATTTSRSPATWPLWSSDPFVPEIRDGRLYARGASDDKGNFLPLLHVACALARDGALPVQRPRPRRGRGGGRPATP